MENTRRKFIKHVTAAGFGVAGLTFAERAAAAVDNATEMQQKPAGKDEFDFISTDFRCQDHIRMKSKNCVRLGTRNALDEKRFGEILDVLFAHQKAIHQITFFLSVSHAPMPLPLVEEYAAILADRMRTAEARGFECGINILCTIGHHEENLDNSLNENYARMTNIDGEVCLGSYCPNDTGMREYIVRLYQIVAKAKPSYIWIDDDIRFGHMPIGYGCFCDNCLRIFADECKVLMTREELRKKFESEDEYRKPEWGLKWLQHNRNTLNRLFRLIEKTVSDIHPDIDLGFMTGERYFEGYGFAEIAEILRGNHRRNVFWRPGGGAYTDERLYDLIEKSHQIGRQVSLLPGYVKLIQSEIENFPYQILKKGPSSTALEAASHIAAGCTGAAYNILPEKSGESMLDSYPLIQKLAQTQPFLDLLVKTFGRTPVSGIYTGWTINSHAAAGMTDGGWARRTGGLGRMVCSHAKELLELGLPVSYTLENAQVVTLSGESVKVMSNEMITQILSGGVYMDAKALDNLNAMGYGKLTGFTAKEYLYKDCIEHYPDHPLNIGGIAGAERNCYQAFNRGDAVVIERTNPKAEILADMRDYNGKRVSECSIGLYKNELGGRICVAGYYPWGFLQSATKARQLKNIFRYLSKDNLLTYIVSHHKLHNWTRKLNSGCIATALINASLDELTDAVIAIKTEKDNCTLFDMACGQHRCPPVSNIAVPAGYKAFALPLIKPWQMVLVVCGNLT